MQSCKTKSKNYQDSGTMHFEDDAEEVCDEESEYEYSDDDDIDFSESEEENSYKIFSPEHCHGFVLKDPPGAGKRDTGKRQSYECENGTSMTSSCTTIDAESLFLLTHRRISDVVEALGIPREAAVIFLGRYGWKTQNVLQAFFEGNDTDSTLRKAGIYHRCSSDSNNATTNNECSICLESFSPSDDSSMMAMPCGHSFCLGCWQDFLENAIIHEGATCFQGLKCPHAGCSEAVTETEISKAAPKLLERYFRFRIGHFIECCGRWCPTPGCNRALVLERGNQHFREGSCRKCEINFCVGCGSEPHGPVSCKTLKKWKEKEQSDSGTANWMALNTKNCPKCNSRIEKNGGCMFMKCGKCAHNFCWACGGTECGHTLTCNKYKEPEDATDKKRRAKSELERYMHYYTRYKNHHDAQKFALKQLVQKKKSSNVNNIDTARVGYAIDYDFPNFLIKANQQLVVCRRVLKYTYVVAFYKFINASSMDNASQLNQQQERFEFHQGTLEMLTEGLSRATEKKPDEIEQQDVINRTGVIGKFIQNLVEYVQDDMDNEVDSREEAAPTGSMGTIPQHLVKVG